MSQTASLSARDLAEARTMIAARLRRRHTAPKRISASYAVTDLDDPASLFGTRSPEAGLKEVIECLKR